MNSYQMSKPEETGKQQQQRLVGRGIPTCGLDFTGTGAVMAKRAQSTTTTYQALPLYPLMRTNGSGSLGFSHGNVNPTSQLRSQQQEFTSYSKPTLNPNASDFIPFQNSAHWQSSMPVERARGVAVACPFRPEFLDPTFDQFEPFVESPPKKFPLSDSFAEIPVLDFDVNSDSSSNTDLAIECNDCMSSSDCGSHLEGATRFKSDLYKTEYCRNLTETGYCKYEAECRFAHSADELRSINRQLGTKYRTVECHDYENGCCYFGPRCWFIHEQPNQRELNSLLNSQLADIYFGCLMGTEYDPFKNLKASSGESRASRWFLDL